MVYCHAGGCSYPEILKALRERGFYQTETPRRTQERATTASQPKSAKPASTNEKQVQALAVWRRSRPATGTSVETYLREARGYTGPIPPSLRYALGNHPSDPLTRHPMMVAAVVRDDRIVAIHRTFLRHDGKGKADLDPDKMTLGPCKGAAVRFAPADPMLAVAEGIETALSLLVTGIPTWAALSGGGLRALVLPAGVREVVIAADPDPVGLMAARAAARRWLSEGRCVRIVRPPLNSDFNDLLRLGS